MENVAKLATQKSGIHHWHPMAEPKAAEQSAPLVFERAEGVYIYDPEELGKICANLLEREIVHQGPHTVAAFIAEPVQGAGGMIVPPANYWPLVREVCDKYGVLLIADEVVTGFGRSGSMFGCQGLMIANAFSQAKSDFDRR